MMRTILQRFGDMIADWLRRVKHAWMWIVAQIAGVAILIALGLIWTRIPEKNAWQVALVLLVPAVIAAGFVVLQAGTFRGFLRPRADDDSRLRVALAWGAATLVIWFAIGWVLWALLDKFDDSTIGWASYLNSRFGANARAHWATYEHLNRDLNWVGWTLRWVIVPGLLMPLASSAAWGLRHLPWRRVLRLYIDWRWWPSVLGCALVGEAWPQTWFEAAPQGNVHAQISRVIWKLLAAYLLAIWCWVKLLGWTAMLLDDAPPAVVADDAAVPLALPDTGDGVGGNA